MHASRAMRRIPARTMSGLSKPSLFASLRGLVARGVGTFDLPELQSADSLHQAAQQSIEEAVRLIKLAEAEQQPDEGTIEVVDRVSDTLCGVADVAEALRNVHSDAGWRSAAEKCCGQMGAFLGQLNGYVPLYEVVRNLADDQQLRARLSEEQARFLDAIRAEYEKDGIHLPEADRARIQQLKQRETELHIELEGNAQRENASLELPKSDVASILRWLPDKSVDAAGDAVTISLSPQVTSTLCSRSEMHHVRQAAYRTGHTGSWSNLRVLDDLARTRLDMARTIGFNSYADMGMQLSMAESREEVDAQLVHLTDALQPLVEEEMDELAAMKRRLGGADRIEAWDLNFLMGAAQAERAEREKKSDANSREATGAPLSGVVEALRLVTRECFGVDLRPTPLAEGESWAPTGAVPAPMKLTVAREGENGAGDEELGTIYVDVGLRQGKAPGSAHYALRCGRQLAPSQVAEGGAAYQLPRVLLSLSVPVANATGSVWLTPQAIGTVFHEFGHALHSVLSRTQFQHFSGTRCASDFVEVPSHLFERFLEDERVVREATGGEGDRFPLAREEAAFGALTELQQILYARFDLHVHGPEPGRVPLQQAYHDLFAEVMPVAPCRDTHWFTRFTHLASYGGHYYSYVYGTALSAALWQHCFAAQPLSRTAGQRLEEAVLVHGGARDPKTMLADAFGEGRDVSVENMLDEYANHLSRLKRSAGE